MEKACGKTGGNGEGEQESCGNGDKRPAGIAASREEREDLVGEVEDEGNEDGPQYETRSQAGHPVPVGHESCRQRLWEPGKLHSKLREKKELEPSGNFSSFDAATGRRTDRGSVSPAYGYIRSAPIKCSNDGGPGPRHKMKGDPGYSIFSMPVVYGYYLHLLTSSEKRVIGRISENPLPPFKPPWAEPPSLPPGVRTPPPAKDGSEAGLGKIVLQPLIRGRRPQQHLEEDVETILGFSARLYEVRELSCRPAQVDQRASS